MTASELPLAGEPAPVVTPARGRVFARPLEFYATRYKADVRNIKRWVAIGRGAEPEDLPPLDRAREMPAWWERHMKIRVKSELLEAAAAEEAAERLATADRDQAEQAARARDEAATAKTVTNAGELGLDNQADSGLLGIAATVLRLQRAERAAGEAWERAVKGQDATGKPIEGAELEALMSRVPMLQRQWEALVESLGKAEKAAAAKSSETGDMLERKSVESALREIHAEMSQDVDSFLKRVWPKLQGLLDSEREEVWKAEAERLKKGFHERFAVG